MRISAAMSSDGARLTAAAAILAASATLGMVVAGAADGARAQRVGASLSAKPSCPEKKGANTDPKKACRAEGSVTAFVTKAGDQTMPTRVRADGKIVAWSVKMSRPAKRERAYFGSHFKNKSLGEAPSGRISILKKSKQKGKPAYKLVRKSPSVDLSDAYGSEPLITLDSPLRIKKGEIVAYTMPTWTPSLALGLSRKKYKWRASRKTGQCKAPKDIFNGHPQEKIGSKRRYGCLYDAALPLYSAYFVKSGGK